MNSCGDGRNEDPPSTPVKLDGLSKKLEEEFLRLDPGIFAVDVVEF